MLDPYTHAISVKPVLPAKKDEHGHWVVRREWGVKLCVLGDYSMRWNRDISAALNMLHNFYYALVPGVRSKRCGAC